MIWTPEAVTQLKELMKTGKTNKEMSVILGISVSSIKSKKSLIINAGKTVTRKIKGKVRQVEINENGVNFADKQRVYPKTIKRRIEGRPQKPVKPQPTQLPTLPEYDGVWVRLDSKTLVKRRKVA